MATWKSNRVTKSIDGGEDLLDLECFWEFQTTADIFTYMSIAKDPRFCSYIKKGDKHTELLLGDDEAKVLFQALYNWISIYEGEHVLKKLIDNNIFEESDETAEED